VTRGSGNVRGAGWPLPGCPSLPYRPVVLFPPSSRLVHSPALVPTRLELISHLPQPWLDRCADPLPRTLPVALTLTLPSRSMTRKAYSALHCLPLGSVSTGAPRSIQMLSGAIPLGRFLTSPVGLARGGKVGFSLAAGRGRSTMYFEAWLLLVQSTAPPGPFQGR
jgi:hypothetical protein